MTYLKLVLSICFLVAFVALWRSRRGPSKRASTALLLALVGMFLLAWPPIAWLLSGSLEWWYNSSVTPKQDAEAIVVLSGGAWPSGPGQPYPIVLEASVIRTRHAAWLYHNWKALPVLACGGPFSRGNDEQTLSDLMEELLHGWGVPTSMTRTERKSGSTYEHAVFATGILRELGVRRIALVTERYHMLRAERCFLKAGFEVVPAPCGFRAGDFEWKLAHLVPGYKAISDNEEAIREWTALAWYWVRGRIEF
jgi:uncharacterized SAM-binding protein YcdF (DUF218 family)